MFESNAPGSSFECKLDRKPFKPCVSPKRYEVGAGMHVFLVRATSPAGDLDATAAAARFEVRVKP
jgi:hypothetical protein